jgi:hypothetical protein
MSGIFERKGGFHSVSFGLAETPRRNSEGFLHSMWMINTTIVKKKVETLCCNNILHYARFHFISSLHNVSMTNNIIS